MGDSVVPIIEGSGIPCIVHWHFNFSQWNPQVWGQSVAFILAIGLWNAALCTQAFAALLLPQLCEPQLFQRGCFWRSSIWGQIMSNHQDFFQKKMHRFFTRFLGWCFSNILWARLRLPILKFTVSVGYFSTLWGIPKITKAVAGEMLGSYRIPRSVLGDNIRSSTTVPDACGAYSMAPQFGRKLYGNCIKDWLHLLLKYRWMFTRNGGVPSSCDKIWRRPRPCQSEHVVVNQLCREWIVNKLMFLNSHQNPQ